MCGLGSVGRKLAVVEELYASAEGHLCGAPLVVEDPATC